MSLAEALDRVAACRLLIRVVQRFAESLRVHGDRQFCFVPLKFFQLCHVPYSLSVFLLSLSADHVGNLRRIVVSYHNPAVKASVESVFHAHVAKSLQCFD